MPPIRAQVQIVPRISIVLFLSLMISACAVKMAPDYDQSVITKLTACNEKIATYFTSFDPSKAYADRHAFYDDVIGQESALGIELRARPTPQPLVLNWLGFDRADTEVGKIAKSTEAPSINAVAMIVKRLEYLRDEDKNKALSAPLVALTRGEVESFMVDALTYEMALKR